MHHEPMTALSVAPWPAGNLRIVTSGARRMLSVGDLRKRWGGLTVQGVLNRLGRGGLLTEERRTSAGYVFTVDEIEALEGDPEWARINRGPRPRRKALEGPPPDGDQET